MKSMTGYGAAQDVHPDFEISVTLKSVNGRFFEPRFHLPKELFFAENAFRAELQKIIRRGTVDVFVYKKEGVSSSVTFNKNLAVAWKKALKNLAHQSGLKVDDDKIFDKLASTPQIFELPRTKKIEQDEIDKIRRTFKSALMQLDKERMREGRGLLRSIHEQLKKLKACVQDIEKLRKQSNEELEERLRSRLEKLGMTSKLDPARFAQELILHIDRSDISEEITRLGEHLSMFQKEVSAGEVNGKKLDFYCQELLREANTIGSKANMARLTERVVEAKGLIEALKEQIQNVE